MTRMSWSTQCRASRVAAVDASWSGDDGPPRLLRGPPPSSSSGELVDSQVLTGPTWPGSSRSDGKTAPVVTDGPFQEFKEWLAGYQIVDAESEARRDRDRGDAVGGARAGRAATQQPIHIRQVMDKSPRDVAEMELYLQQATAAR